MVTQSLSLLAVTGTQKDLPLLVFLPGMDGSALSLRRQADGLKSCFDARCFCIPKDDMTSWAGLAAQLIELVTIEKAKHPERPVYLCGESFGACLGLTIIGSAPHLFERLILINPASSFRRQIWSPLGAFASKWMPSNSYRLAAVGLLPFLIAFDRVSNKDCQALLQAMQQVTPQTAAWRLSLLNEFQLDKLALAQFCRPTLLIASAADRLLPSVSEVQRLAMMLSNSQTIVLENSSHACLLENQTNLYQLLYQARFVSTINAQI